jgi:valyl-tRNA synthetase
MEKKYAHKKYEDKIYNLWEKSGAFAPTLSKKARPYCIIMPPPNANDPLHIGHAMFVTIEDLLIRWRRMQGYSSLWLPGTDHAGIETQFVFEKRLKNKGKSRFDYDRHTLYKMIWDYVQENSGIAIEQMKKLGASADWDRYKFTLDKDIIKYVINTFTQLYDNKLVYRELGLVNYCTHCGTAFSELEVKHLEQKTPLYYMKYGPFKLATVRPETKFGDTAVAVNPKDKRYKKWVGKTIKVKGLIGNFKMKVIADQHVDPEFGTGVLKVTPAHDINDFEIWQRHKNEIPGPRQVIGFDGKLNELTGKYAGLSVRQARKSVVRDLEKEGLLIKIDKNYKHSIGICYRCGTAIEPLPIAQFFIKVKPLTKKALKALADKKVKIIGSGHHKILKHWLENLKDWNISRQIVWGIRIPVWYSAKKNPNIEIVFIDKNGEINKGKLKELLKKYSVKEISKVIQSLRAPVDAEYLVSPTPPGKDYLQETDTFDTWFSSAQWPFVTLKTNQRKDFKRFYPTDVMETAYDILIFWVMRMVMMGIYITKKVPFKNVYLHGLIRDEKGQKMSKSKGNVINPLDVARNYGADALRMALVIRSSAGLDKNVGDNDIRAMRNLTNKIWNSARYVILQSKAPQQSGSPHSARFVRGDAADLNSVSATSNANDRIFKKRLDKLADNVTSQLKKFKIGLAAETLYKEFWHWFCDECIERNKKKEISDKSLLEGLIVFLKLFHPFVPFVTEAVYQELRNNLASEIKEELLDSDLLISSSWVSLNKKNS